MVCVSQKNNILLKEGIKITKTVKQNKKQKRFTNTYVADLGMTCKQQPTPMLSPAQIKKKEAQAGDEKPAQR